MPCDMIKLIKFIPTALTTQRDERTRRWTGQKVHEPGRDDGCVVFVKYTLL